MAVVADAAGPVGAVIDVLTPRLGERLVPLGARAYARACGGFLDDVTARRVAIAVTPCNSTPRRGWRPGDRSRTSWAWTRIRSSADISPIVAATLAVHGVRTVVAKPRPLVVV